MLLYNNYNELLKNRIQLFKKKKRNLCELILSMLLTVGLQREKNAANIRLMSSVKCSVVNKISIQLLREAIGRWRLLEI